MSRSVGRRRQVRAFAERLGLSVPDDAWRRFDEALTHDSFAHEGPRAKGSAAAASATSNERLEFLGDAVLGAATATYLIGRYPSESEGKLSRRRAALVSRTALTATAQRWGVAKLLLLGKGEAAAHGERRPTILAAAVEAVIGAAFTIEGFAGASRLVTHEHLAFSDVGVTADPKTALQELLQSRFKRAPAYAVTSETGPAHARVFVVRVAIGSDLLGTGSGPTKKLAETAAAADALHALQTAGGVRPSTSRA
jgi:ribonuclease-3